MNNDALTAVFDQQASGYERQQKKMSPVLNGLHFLLESIFAELPKDARVLCVGLGTGAELIHLAKKFPGWTFTALEPSREMLNVCRQRVEQEEFSSRCQFHEGYLDTLPNMEKHDAATCFLVSQFILENKARSDFFRSIAHKLNSEAILVSADLSSEVGSHAYNSLLRAWVSMLHANDVPPEALERTHAVWAKSVAILPPSTVEAIIKDGGFETPVEFYQAGLIHAWFSKRAAHLVDD